MNSVTKEYLRSILDYNQHTGVFTWKVSRGKSKIGSDAGSKDKKTGYIRIGFGRRGFLAHRLAFVWMDGVWPNNVDHINRIRIDNRWNNLRSVTRVQNQQNRVKNRNNSSGVKGVSWCKTSKKWIAVISVLGKGKVVGRFNDLIGAELAVRKAREDYAGEFANHG